MNKPMIVAELSCSHLGSFSRAIDIARAAAEAGADAFKVQVWKQDTMCLDDSYYIQSGPWAGRLLKDLYAEAYTPWEWLPTIFKIVRNLGMTPIASPFDAESVDYLETLDCPIYKIASFEITDLPLIRKVASTGKPMIISTGMATEQEIDDALEQIEDQSYLTLLRCTSAYPAAINLASLRLMQAMGENWHCNVGLSDHSTGSVMAVAATVMGATVIEKHLCLSRADGGPDAGFSMEPKEFAEMVVAVRAAAFDMNHTIFGPSESEQSSLALRRSLYIAQDMKAGDILTMANLRTARPAMGLEPKHMHDLLGKPIKQDASRGTPLTWGMV